MAQLQYDISVIGREKLKRALGGVERDLKAHAQRAEGVAQRARRGATGGGAGVRGTAAAKKQTMDAMRGLAQIGAVAAKEEVKIHRKKMANIEKEKRAGIRAEQARARAAEQASKRAHRTRMKFAQGIASGTAGRASNVIRGGATMAGLAGSVMVGGAVKSQMDVDKAATRLANVQYGAGGGKMSRGRIHAGLIQQANKFSGESGISRSEIIAAQKAYQEKSGRLASHTEMDRMVKLSETTGAGMTDLGRAGGELSQSLKDSGVRDPKKRASMVKRLLGKMSASSAVGQIGFEGMVGEIGKITSVAGRNGMDPETAMAEAMGLMQFSVQGGATDAPEAGTAMARFSDMLIKKGKNLKGIGVETFKDGEMRSHKDVLLDILQATGGDVRKISGAGVDIRAMKIAEAPAKLYRQAIKSGMSEGDARGFVSDKLSMLQGGNFKGQDLDKSSEFSRDTTGSKIAQTMERFNQEVGTKLMPVLADALPMFAEGVKAAASGLKWFIDNPLTGIGGIIAATVAGDIAKAGIGEAVKGGFERMFKGVEKKGDKKDSGLLGKGGAAVIGAAIGLSVASSLAAYGIGEYKEGQTEIKRRGEIQTKLHKGEITPEEARKMLLAENLSDAEKKSESDTTQKTVNDVGNAALGKALGFATGNNAAVTTALAALPDVDFLSLVKGALGLDENDDMKTASKEQLTASTEADIAAVEKQNALREAASKSMAEAAKEQAAYNKALSEGAPAVKKLLDALGSGTPPRTGKPVVDGG